MGSLAGGIAHDFNNILGVLSGSIGTLRRAREGDRSKRDEVLAGMEKAIDRGAAFVRQLLTFARRSDTDKHEVVDLNAVVKELEAMLRETLPAPITLEMRLDEGVPAVEADSTQLHQALLNLAVNARDAMPHGGRLEIGTAAETGETVRQRFPAADAGRYASITVRDTGNGMDGETKRRIFEPFFTTKQSIGGSGLGLAVAYGIVQGHAGFIDVESEPAKGAAFTIYLPAAEDGGGRKKKPPAKSEAGKRGAPAKSTSDAPAPKASAASEAPRSAKTVLLVEDEPLLLDSMRALAESEGYRVLTATDGADAVRLYETATPRVDVVVSDVKMPRLGGWETYLKIRQQDPSVRVILASGVADRAERRKWKEAGVRASLRKPFNADEFLRTLREATEN
jgi:CheY-like chemotaxis protein